MTREHHFPTEPNEGSRAFVRRMPLVSLPSRLTLWLLWGAASAVGGALAGAGSTFPPVLDMLSPALFAAPQWLVLSLHIPGAGWWVPITMVAALTAGAVAGMLVVLLAYGASVGVVALPLIAFAFGAVFGAIQWTVLFRRVPRAAWWIPASGVGAVALLGGIAALQPLAPGPVGRGFAGGAAYGLSTGVVLTWLLSTGRHATEPGRRAPTFAAG